ncbi:MAG: respiratory nitrate reductase subunit gamma [Calditrichaeota bacterium]|nr:MAG: respiratory nitrate reductase subunit gamma [Calditrichota bacterium]
MSETFFFVAFPYMCLALFFIGTIHRYRKEKFTYSSLSSQFLESEHLFFGSMPFHYGILLLFFGHLFAFLFPKTLMAINRIPVRLYIIEASAFIFALGTLVGLLNLIYRRLTNHKIRQVTTVMDIFILLLFLVEVSLGMHIALAYRWGSAWFPVFVTPYLRSLFRFSPNLTTIANLPFTVKAHIVIAFGIFAIIPITRLVHILVAPLHYIVRPYQRVIWNWERKKIATPEEVEV